MTGLVLHHLSLGSRYPSLHFHWQGGAHALTGLSQQQLSELYACISGVARPQRGHVLLDGQNPYRDPILRTRIGAAFPSEPRIEERLDVRSFVSRVEEYRRAQSKDPRRTRSSVHTFLPAHWGDQPVQSLTPPQRRRLALHLALSLPEPRLLLLHDPWRALAPGEEELFLSLLRERIQGGTLLVLTGTQPLATRLLGAEQHELSPAFLGETGITYLLRLDRPREFAEQLLGAPGIHHVELDPNRPLELLVTGSDTATLGAALTRAHKNSDTQLFEMIRVPQQILTIPHPQKRTP